MAIFAPANTSGYGDPLKAMSIKALEQRQKDLLAQQAAQQPDPAMMATIPGGIGSVLGIVGDNMRQGRADAALASQRDMLARTITRMDPNNPKPEELAHIAVASPEMYAQLMTQMADARRQQAGYTHDDAAAAKAAEVASGVRKETFGHEDATARNLFGHQDQTAAKAAETAELARQAGAEEARGAAGDKAATEKAAAAELAKTTEALAAANEKRVQDRPSEDPAAVIMRAQKSGELPPDIAKRRIDQVTAPKTAELNFIAGQSEKSIEAQSLLGQLDTAYNLLDTTHGGKGIHTGPWAGATQRAGENMPGFIQGAMHGITPDPEVTKNTQRFNQIMGVEVLASLNAMKGASSDPDLNYNLSIVNDPNASYEAKRDALLVLKAKMPEIIKNHNKAIEAAGGTAPVVPAAKVTLGAAPQSTSADPARAAAADPGRAAAADPAAAPKTVEGITEAQAKELPVGTRFKLIDGRTGTAR